MEGLCYWAEEMLASQTVLCNYLKGMFVGRTVAQVLYKFGGPQSNVTYSLGGD
jgi:hypothetical protein